MGAKNAVMSAVEKDAMLQHHDAWICYAARMTMSAKELTGFPWVRLSPDTLIMRPYGMIMMQGHGSKWKVGIRDAFVDSLWTSFTHDGYFVSESILPKPG